MVALTQRGARGARFTRSSQPWNCISLGMLCSSAKRSRRSSSGSATAMNLSLSGCRCAYAPKAKRLRCPAPTMTASVRFMSVSFLCGNGIMSVLRVISYSIGLSVILEHHGDTPARREGDEEQDDTTPSREEEDIAHAKQRRVDGDARKQPAQEVFPVEKRLLARDVGTLRRDGTPAGPAGSHAPIEPDQRVAVGGLGQKRHREPHDDGERDEQQDVEGHLREVDAAGHLDDRAIGDGHLAG